MRNLNKNTYTLPSPASTKGKVVSFSLVTEGAIVPKAWTFEQGAGCSCMAPGADQKPHCDQLAARGKASALYVAQIIYPGVPAELC